MKKKKKRGRKTTHRTQPIFVRVKPDNAQYFKNMATRAQKSQAEIMDQVLEGLRAKRIKLQKESA